MDIEGDSKVDAFETREKGCCVPQTDDSSTIPTLESDETQVPSLPAVSISLVSGPEIEVPSLPVEQAVSISLVSGPEIEAIESSITQKRLRYRNIGGNFITGIDITSEDEIRRREERGKRFGISQEEVQQQLQKHSFSGEDMEVDVSKLEARSKRFGTELVLAQGRPVKIVASLPPIAEGRIRLKAVHLHGSDEMSTEDILEYFSPYGPRNIEWIDDKSCNIVWDDDVSARRALNGLGQRPLAVMGSDSQTQTESDDRQDKPLESASGGENEKEDIGDIKGVQAKSEMGEERETTDPRSMSEINVEGEGEATEGKKMPDKEGEMVMVGSGSVDIQWWLAPPHPRAKQLLIRYATVGDMKTLGAAKRSHYYKKYGNPNTMEPQSPLDLRDRLGRKRTHSSTEQVEEEGEKIAEDTMDLDDSCSDPLATLVKRPRRMHADRDEEEEEYDRLERGGEGEGEGNDLRRLLKKKRKKRDLKMRLGDYPRLVEEQR